MPASLAGQQKSVAGNKSFSVELIMFAMGRAACAAGTAQLSPQVTLCVKESLPSPSPLGFLFPSQPFSA